MQKSRLFRFRPARGAALLGVALTSYLLAVGAVGCSGQSTHSSDVDPAGGTTQADGGKHAAGSKAGGAGGGGNKPTAGGSSGKSGGGGSNLGGNASAGNGRGGAGSGGTSSSFGGQTLDGGAPGAAAGSPDAGAPTEPTVGVTGGRKICVDGVCGFACLYDGAETFPGDPFWIDCNSCVCKWDGAFDCETKDCTKDCAYFENEYQGAYGEAQYCLMDPGKPDPCSRLQSASLYCDCPTAVSTDPEFIFYSQQWVKRWKDGGCAKPDEVVCPPCHQVVGAHCDMEQGVCVSQ